MTTDSDTVVREESIREGFKFVTVAVFELLPIFDLYTVPPAKNVRGRFPAFLAFKATNQRPIIILLFETLQL